MARSVDVTKLTIEPREVGHSRASRRLRREGRVPGVLYGLGRDALSFSVDAHELRHALHASGAVIELHDPDGANATAAVLKEAQRHPVRGELMHIDLLRVDLDKPIQAPVPLHLVGIDDAPGHRDGGVLEQVTREVTVEALPNDIPEFLEIDISTMEINDTYTLTQLTAPPGVAIVDAVETVVANLSPPKLSTETDELETETEVVGEGQAEPGAEGEVAEAGEADAGDTGGEDAGDTGGE